MREFEFIAYYRSLGANIRGLMGETEKQLRTVGSFPLSIVRETYPNFEPELSMETQSIARFFRLQCSLINR